MVEMYRQHLERHTGSTSFIRDFVFGFGDGINTSLGIVSGIGGANASNWIIILGAFIATLSGAMAMGVQNYLAVKSERELLEAEVRRERHEIEHMPDQEKKEIREIYAKKGFTEEELDFIVERITVDKERWLRTMLVEELGLNLDVVKSPWKNAIVMFLAFMMGGIIPILPRFALTSQGALMGSVLVSVIASFLVGAYKATFTGRSKLRSGLEMTVLGTGIALVGYAVGKLFTITISS